VKAGFDDIYLDIIDAYGYFEELSLSGSTWKKMT